jgi:hypothetical protein
MDSIRFFDWTGKNRSVSAEWVKVRFPGRSWICGTNWICLPWAESMGPEIRFNHEYKRRTDTPLNSLLDGLPRHGSIGATPYDIPPAAFDPVGQGVFLTQDSRYARGRVQLTAFWKQCPYLAGVNWIMPMESGIRLISLCWIAAFLKDYLRKQPGCADCLKTWSRATFSTQRKLRRLFIGEQSFNQRSSGFLASISLGICPAWSGISDPFHLMQRFPVSFIRTASIGSRMHYQLFCHDLFQMAWLLGRQNGLSIRRNTSEFWAAPNSYRHGLAGRIVASSRGQR